MRSLSHSRALPLELRCRRGGRGSAPREVSMRMRSVAQWAREAGARMRGAMRTADYGTAGAMAGLLMFLVVWTPHPAVAQSGDKLEDDMFWEGARGCESIKGTRLYLDEFPKGRHAAEAAGCIAWVAIEACEEKEPVERFLVDFPESRYAEEARACLERLERLEARERKSVLVERLLSECRAHHQASRLTAGSGGNALDCYRRVLDEDPGNVQALEGITAIERHYADKAEAALGRERPDAAERSISRLEAINPEHPRIEAFNTRLEELKRALAERERRAAERQELGREIEELLAQGKPGEARSRLAAGRKRGLSGKALAALEKKIGEAFAEAERTRVLAEQAAEIRALAGRGEIPAARELLGEARAGGLGDATHGELEAAIAEAEARRAAEARAAEIRRLLEACAGHGEAKRLAEAVACYRQVLALEPGHAEAAAAVRRLEPLVAWKEVSGKDTVEGYYGFEGTHAGSLFARLARHRLEELEASYWKSVQEAGTAEAYGRYLEIYPEGRFAALARRRASPEE